MIHCSAMGVREERRQAAREGVLAAAHRQVAEAGLASASMTAVAARAGVATGSIYRHFPSRGELLAAVVGDALRGEQVLLDRAGAAAEPVDGVTAWIRTALERGGQAPRLTHALLHEPSEPSVEAIRREAQRRRESGLAKLLRHGAASGAWPPGPSALQATAILGAVQAVVAGPDATTGGADLAAAELVTFTLRALGAPVA